jgi:hypothetical protein
MLERHKLPLSVCLLEVGTVREELPVINFDFGVAVMVSERERKSPQCLVLSFIWVAQEARHSLCLWWVQIQKLYSEIRFD